MYNGTQQILTSIVTNQKEIRDLAAKISDGQLATFAPLSIRQPDLSIPIHGFHTSISWLYVLYYESGKIAIEFLTERSYSLGLDPERSIPQHINLIHSLRTYLQHNLDAGKSSDMAKIQCCNNWICKYLESDNLPDKNIWPNDMNEWAILVKSILSEANHCFEIMLSTIKLIASDESFKDTVKVWISREKRFHAPYEFDEIIDSAATDLGFKFINPIIIRNKYFPEWNSKLAFLKEGYDFNNEARLLIEKTLVFEEELPVPISGTEIMSELGIEAGPEVRRLKEEAQRLYNENPRCKEDIINLLRKSIK